LLLNLLLNAIEATGEERAISVEVGATDMAFIRIQDNGGGMSDDFIKNDLFKPFHSTKEKGLGIGLYQSRQIAQAHGGSIEVSSRLGVGSVFTVWLPKSAEPRQFDE
jgi:signal transduction histidine kinase